MLGLSAMTLHPPTLLLVCAIAASFAAATMTWFGARHRIYRGHWFWTASQWLLAAGLALQVGAASNDLVSATAHLLILQWPICVLAGLRRFYSRHGLRVRWSIDLVLFGLVWLSAAAFLQVRAAPNMQLLVWSAGPLLLLAYVAILVTLLGEFKSSPALKLLSVGLGAAALANAYRFAAGFNAQVSANEALLMGSLIMVFPAMLMLPVALLLNFQRTEHTWLAEQRKLRYIADMDVLTRLPNRRHFHELATEALAATQADAASVMAFDIDHFKRINEMFGHAAGDEALRQVSQCMRDTLREPDVAGRVGSNEFVILLPNTLPKGAMAAASRIVAQLAKYQPAPRMATLSLSFGIVQLYEAETIDNAQLRAEQALFEAKRQGRSRMVVGTGSSDHPLFTNSRTLGLFGT